MYQRFDTLPAGWTRAVWEGDNVTNETDPFKWSADVIPPAVGSVITITMNKLGRGVVRGYFVEYGWLGLLVELVSPPAWWRKQNDAKTEASWAEPKHYAHIFGADLPKPVPPKPRQTKRKVTVDAIAAEIAAMDKSDDIAVFGPRILDIMRGVSRDVFTELDDKGGNGRDDCNGRFYMLRCVRNDREWGQKMFDGFKR